MACTIVSTPATGAADWTGWITQQGLTDRGFMRVSLTEFATTTASLIGTGSVFELAGSIYSCSGAEAISLAAGTASAAVAVYFVAIPSAGGTTCTFTMDSTVPTWVDAKQGYYASAASTSRYLGGAQIATAVTYYTKFIYTPDMVFGYLLPQAKTRPILKKILEIGEWNMDDTGNVDIPHGIIQNNIRRMSVIIYSDTNLIYDFVGYQSVQEPADFNISLFTLSSNVIRLVHDSAGAFDAASFDGTASTVANRGWIYIEYEA